MGGGRGVHARNEESMVAGVGGMAASMLSCTCEPLQTHYVSPILRECARRGGTERERENGNTHGGSPQTRPDARRLFVLNSAASGQPLFHTCQNNKLNLFCPLSRYATRIRGARVISVFIGPAGWTQSAIGRIYLQVCGLTTQRPPENSGVLDQRDANRQGVVQYEARKVKFK